MGNNQKYDLKIIQLLISMSDRRLWIFEEDQLIRELVGRYGTKKWTEVAQEMKQIYPHLARTSKQIRERWHNHLDPAINHTPWTPQEEAIVFDAHRKIGSRWKDIAHLLKSRTDNSVKNYFYSTLRRSLRRINKFLGFKNSTNQMKLLKPTILNALIEEGEKSEEARQLISGIFQFSKIKPNKSKMNSISLTDHFSEDKKEKYLQAIERLNLFKYKVNDCSENYELREKNAKVKRIKWQIETVVKTEEKDDHENINEEMTSKGHESYEEMEVKWEEISEEYEIHDKNWEESEVHGFGGMLPQLDVPEADQDFMPMECKIQQFFL